MRYRLKLIVSSKQGLEYFDIDRFLILLSIKTYRKNNEYFLIQLLNAWLHFTNDKFPTPTHIAENLGQFIYLNLHTNLKLSSNISYFYSIAFKEIIENKRSL